MYLKQYYLDCLAHASYMIVDQGTGMAAVVDHRACSSDSLPRGLPGRAS